MVEGRGRIYVDDGPMQTIFSDRRKTARHTVHLPINVSEIGTGSTVDVTAAGVAFLIDADLEPGREIRFQFPLEDNQILLVCDGRVVRVEKRGPTIFAAATIEEFSIAEIAH